MKQKSKKQRTRTAWTVPCYPLCPAAVPGALSKNASLLAGLPEASAATVPRSMAQYLGPNARASAAQQATVCY